MEFDRIGNIRQKLMVIESLEEQVDGHEISKEEFADRIREPLRMLGCDFVDLVNHMLEFWGNALEEDGMIDLNPDERRGTTRENLEGL